MKTAMDDINAVVRRHGLHKLASRMIEADGLPAPKEWTIGEVALTLGTKLAQDRINHRSVMTGLASLNEVAGGFGEKTASLGLYAEFSRVKNLRETIGKTASEHEATDLLGYEIGFWQRCKLAAANDPEGPTVGLAKLALSLLLSADAAGEKVASSQDDALAFATSFACAAVVDDAIVAMVKSAELTPKEGLKLAALNAQAAINDLKEMTKSAGSRLTQEMHAAAGTPAMASMATRLFGGRREELAGRVAQRMAQPKPDSAIRAVRDHLKTTHTDGHFFDHAMNSRRQPGEFMQDVNFGRQQGYNLRELLLPQKG